MSETGRVSDTQKYLNSIVAVEQHVQLGDEEVMSSYPGPNSVIAKDFKVVPTAALSDA